jgi:hypothetical protein
MDDPVPQAHCSPKVREARLQTRFLSQCS